MLVMLVLEAVDHSAGLVVQYLDYSVMRKSYFSMRSLYCSTERLNHGAAGSLEQWSC